MNRTLRALCLVCLLFAVGSVAATSDQGPEEMPDPGTTHLSDSPATIEMNLHSGRPMVELMIDGQGPFKFVVDTGAAFSVIDQRIADRLDLEVVGEQRLHSPGATEDIVGKRVEVGRLEVGGLRIERPVVATMDLVGFSMGTIEGVLGRSHFRELLLTFDYPRSRLVITPGALDRSDPAVIVYDQGADSIQFPIDVAGESVPMVLDTGSQGGFTLPKALETRFKFGSELRSGPTIRLVGGTHKTWMAPLEGSIRLGEIHYENPDVVLGTFSDEFGNLGLEVLRELRITLDQASGLVRFERSAAVGVATAAGGGATRVGGPVRMGGPQGQPQLGVMFEMTPAGFIKKDGGLVVERVVEGGLADQAGLRAADIVLTLGGTAVTDIEGMMAIAKLVQGPRPLEIGLLRGEEQLTITID